VAHFDHLIWPTWVVILCIILLVLVLSGLEIFKLVVVVAVVMWKSPQRFPRAGGSEGKQFYRFPSLSTDRHFHCLVFGARDFLSAFFAPFQRSPETK
jgi:hypothetical protein